MLRKASLVLLLFLSACALAPPGPPPDKALVHIYRRTLPPGPSVITLYDGAEPIGRLQNGTYLDYLTTPGPRVFKATSPGTGSLPYATSLVGGQTYWFMIYVLGNQMNGNATIAPMDEATAEKQMASLKAAQPQ